MREFLIKAGMGILVASAAVSPASAQSVADFYKGKQIEFIIATTPGGSYDQWTRLLARHMSKYIPGNPTFVPKNMPGSGHIKAASYMFSLAAKDGTSIATFTNSIISGYVLKAPGIDFDVTKFNWLGSPDMSNRGCVASAGVAVQKAEDLFDHDLVVGGTGPTSSQSQTPLLLQRMLGMRFKLVDGYPGADQVFLHMERGEVDGICTIMPAIEAGRPGAIAEGKLKVLFNMEKDPLPGINAPSIYKFTKTDEQNRIIAFYNSNLELGRPFLAPPDVPKDRVEALRQAFASVLRDPGLMQEAAKMNLDILPITAEELGKRVDQMVSTSSDIIEKTNKLLTPDSAPAK